MSRGTKACLEPKQLTTRSDSLLKSHVTRMLSKESGMVNKARGCLDSTFCDRGFKGVPMASRPSRQGGRAAYEVLDIVDFGVTCRSAMPAPVSGSLVVKRSDAKDHRKRWNQDFCQTSRKTTPVESLCTVLAVYQPDVAAMVGRAQSVEKRDEQGGFNRRKSSRR